MIKATENGEPSELAELKELRAIIREELQERPTPQERQELLRELAKVQEKITHLGTVLYE